METPNNNPQVNTPVQPVVPNQQPVPQQPPVSTQPNISLHPPVVQHLASQSNNIVDETFNSYEESVNSVEESKPEKKKKGCLSVLIKIFFFLLVVGLIIFFTSRLWYPSLFKKIFPESSNPTLYTEPLKKSLPVNVNTQEWTMISYPDFTFYVPFGEVVDIKEDPLGEMYNAYHFSNGDAVWGDPAICGNNTSNFRMQELCFFNYDTLEMGRNLYDHVVLTFLLLSRGLLDTANTQDNSGGSYYFENDDMFVCQMGSVSNPEQESLITFFVIPSSSNPENECSYSKIFLASKNLTQLTIGEILSTISFKE